MNKALVEQEIAQRVEVLSDLLVSTGQTLSTAESCTGGWIAQACTELAGSSRWFEGGIVSYSNAAKMRLLGVPEQTITNCGAVSQAVVESMVAGAIEALHSDLAVAVSGVAGPGGGSAEKPVGTVWIAWGNTRCITSHCFRFSGDRYAVRAQTVIAALQQLTEQIEPRD